MRPLGLVTVVVQPLRTARKRAAPMVERSIVRIGSFGYPLVRNGGASWVCCAIMWWQREPSADLSPSGSKSSGELAAIDLTPLVHRNFFDKKYPLWDLPPAQPRPAIFEQIGLAHLFSRYDAGRDLFIAQD